jgi:hypothetical protein
MKATALSALAALSLVVAPAARAEDDGKLDCTLSEGKDDRLVQDKDLVLEPGDKVKQAVALRGNVRVKRGAQVEDVVAINGSVTLEPGASVEGDAVAVGGKVHAREGSEIKGDAIALGGKLRLDKKAKVGGGRVSMQIDVNGSDIVQSFLDKVFEGRQKCRIVKAKPQDAADGSVASQQE